MFYPYIDDEADAEAGAEAPTMAGGGLSDGAEDERASGWGAWPSKGAPLSSSTLELPPPMVNWGERSAAVPEMSSANPSEKVPSPARPSRDLGGATLVDPAVAIDGTFTPIATTKREEERVPPAVSDRPNVSRIKAGDAFGQTGGAWPTPVSATGDMNTNGDDWSGASSRKAMGEPEVAKASPEKAKPDAGWGGWGAQTIVVSDAERKEAERASAERARLAAEQRAEPQVIIRKDGQEVKGFELGPLEPVAPRSEKLPPLEAADKMEEVFFHPWRLLPFVGSGEELVEIGKLGLAAYRLSEADKNGSEADPEDLKLVRDYVAQQNRETTTGYKITSVIAALPAFAMELGLTGGIYTAGEKVALKAGKMALEKYGTKAGMELLERIAARTAAKKAGREVADVVGKTAKEKAAEFALRGVLATSGAAAQTVPAAGLRVASDTIQRMMPEFQFSEDERGKLSAIVTGEGDDFGPAMLKAFGNQFAEVLSERTSGALAFMPGAEKLRLLKTQIMRQWFGAHPGATPSQFAKLVHATGWHDVLGEMFEERVGDAMKAGMGLQSWSEVIPTPEQMLVEGVSFMAPGPIRGVWRSAVKQAHGFSSSRGTPTGRSAVAGATLAMPETQKRNTGAARQVQAAPATGSTAEVTSGAGATTSAAETSVNLAESEKHAAGAGDRVPSEAPQFSQKPSVVGPGPAGVSSSATEPATLPAEGANAEGGSREAAEMRREPAAGQSADSAELLAREQELPELPTDAAPFQRDPLAQRVRALPERTGQRAGAHSESATAGRGSLGPRLAHAEPRMTTPLRVSSPSPNEHAMRPFGEVDPVTDLGASVETANGQNGIVVAVQGPVVKFRQADGMLGAAHIRRVRVNPPASSGRRTLSAALVSRATELEADRNPNYDTTHERAEVSTRGRTGAQLRDLSATRRSSETEAWHTGIPESPGTTGKRGPSEWRLAISRRFAGSGRLVQQHLQRLGARIVKAGYDEVGGGLSTRANGEIWINAERLRDTAQTIPDHWRGAFYPCAYIEELAHLAHNLVHPNKRRSCEVFWQKLSPDVRALVQASYRPSRPVKSEGATFGSEAVRMYVQFRNGFPITESFHRNTFALELALRTKLSAELESVITQVSGMLLRGRPREMQAWKEEPPTNLGLAEETPSVVEPGAAGASSRATDPATIPVGGSGLQENSEQREATSARSDDAGTARTANFNAGTPSEATTTVERPQRAADESRTVNSIDNPAPAASPVPSTEAPRGWGDVTGQDIGQTVEDHRGRRGTVVQVSKGAVMARMADGRMIGIERGHARIIPAGENTGSRTRFRGVEAANRQLPKRGGARRSAFTARQMGMLVARIYAQNRSLYEAMGVGQPEVDVELDGALAMENGHLVINPARLAEQSASLARGGYSTEKWVREAMREEWLHAAQMEAESRAGRNWEKTYAAIWNDAELDTALRAGAARSYAGFDQLSEAQKGAEVMRMVLSARWTGTITERVYRAVQAFVDYLRGLDVAAQKSELFRETLARAEAVIREAHEGTDFEPTRKHRSPLGMLYAASPGDAERRLLPAFRRAVEEDARNGYPGFAKDWNWPPLARAERVLEADFAQIVAQDMPAALARYHQLAVEDFGMENYLNADLGRMLYPPYAQSPEMRIALAQSTKAVGGYISLKLAFEKALSEPRTPDKPLALFLAGGPASGKTTAVNTKLKRTKQRSALIYDAPFSNYESARTAIARASDAGLDPKVVFVFRPFELAVEGMLNRTIEEGRAVDAEFMARTHYDAQANFFRLAEELGSSVEFDVWRNDGAPEDMDQLSLEDFRSQSYANHGENERRTTSRATASEIPEGDRAPEESETLRRLRDRGRIGEGARSIQRRNEAERGRLGERARQGSTTESLLGRVGDEAQRKAALREFVRQRAEAAYREGRINAVQYRGIVPEGRSD